MIKNDRQYRLTKVQVRTFENAIADLYGQRVPPGVDRKFSEVQQRALESQIEEMTSDVKEYEALKNGKVTAFEAQSLDELPTMLVKARIARGMTHRELAERLNVKEQQVQRWEANDFCGASIENLKAIADALGVVLTQRLYVPRSEVTPKTFLSSLNESGLSSDFILRRIVQPQIAASLRSESGGLKEIVSAAGTVAKVFGLKMTDLVEMRAPPIDYSAVAAARFKLPARVSKQSVSAYAIYAHYLAALLVQCAEGEPKRTVPNTPLAFYSAVTRPGEPMSFQAVARFLWDCGVIVLPLSDAGGFHGAVWKIRERFVIVVKQTTQLESRWLYDALHETGHIRNGDVTDEVSLIEEQEISPEISGVEEKAANDWAEDALFNGKSDELEEACAQACSKKLQNLKSALPSIAKAFNVNLGSLANHMAYRLADEGENWWGAANNLQTKDQHPFSTARDILFEHVNLFHLSPFDRELLQRAMSEE